MKLISNSIFFLAIVLFSCGGKSTTNNQSTENDTTGNEKVNLHRSKYDTQKFIGEYMGAFGKNTLILDINYVNGNNVSGFNIVKGNRRNIKGTLEDKGNTFVFKMEEPGNDKYDGIFDFTIDTTSLNVSGEWTPNDTSLSKKTFTLKRRSEKGQPEGYSGTWFLENFTVELKTDGTGIAKGGYEDKKANWIETEIKCTWIDEGEGITIEWAKNPAFKKATMKFKKQEVVYDGSSTGEQYLKGDDYEMYRYW